LQSTHLSCKRRLVTHGARHTAQKRRHLRARLRKPENVINEQQHVLALLIAEILSHRKSGKRNTQTRTRRLVHLTKHQRSAALLAVTRGNNARLNHLVPEIVTFTSTLTHTTENRKTTMAL